MRGKGPPLFEVLPSRSTLYAVRLPSGEIWREKRFWSLEAAKRVARDVGGVPVEVSRG